MNVHDAIHFAVFLHRQPPPLDGGGGTPGGGGAGGKTRPGDISTQDKSKIGSKLHGLPGVVATVHIGQVIL